MMRLLLFLHPCFTVAGGRTKHELLGLVQGERERERVELAVSRHNKLMNPTHTHTHTERLGGCYWSIFINTKKEKSAFFVFDSLLLWINFAPRLD